MLSETGFREVSGRTVHTCSFKVRIIFRVQGPTLSGSMSVQLISKDPHAFRDDAAKFDVWHYHPKAQHYHIKTVRFKRKSGAAVIITMTCIVCKCLSRRGVCSLLGSIVLESKMLNSDCKCCCTGIGLVEEKNAIVINSYASLIHIPSPRPSRICILFPHTLSYCRCAGLDSMRPQKPFADQYHQAVQVTLGPRYCTLNS